jgi:hypothetical protein
LKADRPDFFEMGRFFMGGPLGPLFLFEVFTMDRVAVFVDAGYVFAAGSILVTGEKLTRAQST